MKLLFSIWIALLAAGVSFAQAPLPIDCAREPLAFASGRFQLDGDLLLPRAPGPHPVIVYVWGAGPTNRERHIERSPVLRVFLEQGYAVYLYDKPGSGGSTGEVDPRRQFDELATVLADALTALRQREDIARDAIGLYGSSQASYVMATAFARGLEASFVIAWSCPMQNSIEQGAFLFRNYVLCDGGSPELAAEAGDAYRRRAHAQSYAGYREAAATLDGIASIRDGLGWAGVRPADNFTPADSTSEFFFDPAPAFAGLAIPVLALYAENDSQVDPMQGAESCRAWMAKAHQPLSTVVMVPGADHNMVLSPRGCMQDQRDDYRAIGGRTVSPVFLETIGAWLGQRSGRPGGE
jgi:hypothetical protein